MPSEKITIITLKICSRCKIPKSVKEFYKQARQPDGLHYNCIICCTVLNNASRLKAKATKGSDKHKWVRGNPLGIKFSKRQTYRDPEGDATISLHELYLRDNGVCARCKKLVLPKDATLDHRVPIVRGGKHQWDNCQLMHEKCNKSKGAKDE